MPLIEMVEYVQEQQYVVVEHFCSTYYIEIQGFLILDQESQKYNFYVLDYCCVKYPINPRYIVENFEAAPLFIAQQAFPKYNLTEENYGFKTSNAASR